MTRQSIDRYATFRASGRMMERALRQSPPLRDINAEIRAHELAVRRLKAIKILQGWITNIYKWDQPDARKIKRYRRAINKLLDLTNLY